MQTKSRDRPLMMGQFAKLSHLYTGLRALPLCGANVATSGNVAKESSSRSQDAVLFCVACLQCGSGSAIFPKRLKIPGDYVTRRRQKAGDGRLSLDFSFAGDSDDVVAHPLPISGARSFAYQLRRRIMKNIRQKFPGQRLI